MTEQKEKPDTMQGEGQAHVSKLIGVNTAAPVNEIIAILAKHKISIVLIDDVFKRVKDRVVLQSVVTVNLTQETLL